MGLEDGVGSGLGWGVGRGLSRSVTDLVWLLCFLLRLQGRFHGGIQPLLKQGVLGGAAQRVHHRALLTLSDRVCRQLKETVTQSIHDLAGEAQPSVHTVILYIPPNPALDNCDDRNVPVLLGLHVLGG